MGGWVGPTAGLDDVEKILDRTRAGTTDPSAFLLVASRYIDYAITAVLL
jgi:hypothetical protein